MNGFATSIAVALLVAVAVCLAFYSYRRTNEARLVELRRREGELVTLGVSGYYIVRNVMGRLELDDRGRTVSVTNAAPRSIRVEQVRWISDPDTGRRIAGRW